MKNKKNIEHFFQENFKDFQAQPPVDSWDEISRRLNQEKKRKVLPLWIKFSSIAATFLLGLFLFENNSDKSQTQSITSVDDTTTIHTNNNTNDKNLPTLNSSKDTTELLTGVDNLSNSSQSTENQTLSSSSRIPKNTVVSLSTSSNTFTSNTSKYKNSTDKTSRSRNEDINLKTDFVFSEDNNRTEIVTNNENKSVIEKSQSIFNQTIDFTYNASTTDSDSRNEDVVAIAEEPKEESNEILDYLAQLEEASQDKEAENNSSLTNRWSLTPNVAPITMNSFSIGSPMSEQLNGNSKEYLASMSVGLGVNYAVTDKINIRTGVNKFMVGYNTHDVVVYATANVIDLLENQMNINYTNTSGNVVVKSENLIATESANIAMPQTTGYLNHKFGYIEIPMEVSYKLLDTKFNIDIIGGFSTLFLQENEVSVIGNGMKTTLGEANNMNDIHFSTNLGVGFRYEIFKSFDISLEPMFKYQIGTYSKNSEGFKPYILGIYTGLSFKF